MPDGLSIWVLLAGCLATFAASWIATWAVRGLLLRFHILDRPNARSSHSEAKPRGGGLALLPVLLIAWLIAAQWFGAPPDAFAFAILGALWLLAVSWLDDLRNLSALTRLVAQAVAVAVGMIAMGEAEPVFQGLLPPLADRLAAGLAWLWFINLFNFMDGIDGISGVETVAIGLGLGLVAWTAGMGPEFVALPWLLAAAVLGFLLWNWAPAKLFLGDVGSVPLGFLLGWLLLSAAAQGQWVAALILPSYYLADATLTLLTRTLRGGRPWQAHREHFYQKAVAGGRGHGTVAGAVAGCNWVLLGLALAGAAGYALLALVGAGIAVAIFLSLLHRWSLGR